MCFLLQRTSRRSSRHELFLVFFLFVLSGIIRVIHISYPNDKFLPGQGRGVLGATSGLMMEGVATKKVLESCMFVVTSPTEISKQGLSLAETASSVVCLGITERKVLHVVVITRIRSIFWS